MATQGRKPSAAQREAKHTRHSKPSAPNARAGTHGEATDPTTQPTNTPGTGGRADRKQTHTVHESEAELSLSASPDSRQAGTIDTRPRKGQARNHRTACPNRAIHQANPHQDPPRTRSAARPRLSRNRPARAVEDGRHGMSRNA